MPCGPALYLGLGVTTTMATLVDIASGGFHDQGYIRLALLAFISGGSVSLSALTWND